MWLDFQKKRGKAISKDTWSLLVDFIRSIDAQFKDYDESGEYLTSFVHQYSLTSQERGRRLSMISLSITGVSRSDKGTETLEN